MLVGAAERDLSVDLFGMHLTAPLFLAPVGVLGIAAQDDVSVLFDSGIRSGSDLVTALALGATAVGLGRPYVHGLALGGTDGVVHVVRSVLAEADLLMAVDGFPDLAALRMADVRVVRAG
jgi:lactate 2-monooxygenase